jgi:hypothetical protein
MVVLCCKTYEKSNVQNLHIAGSGKLVKFYNLILSPLIKLAHRQYAEHNRLSHCCATFIFFVAQQVSYTPKKIPIGHFRS